MNTYTLNISRLQTKADHVTRYYHWARVDFGDCGPEVAMAKAQLIKQAMDMLDVYNFTLTCTPCPVSTSVDL